jgi:phosphocarrier protein
MQKHTVIINNNSGLHARPASLFVNAAGKFKSDIRIIEGKDVINGKSIIAVLSAGIKQGTEISIVAEGDDEEEAICKLVELIEAGLGEIEKG